MIYKDSKNISVKPFCKKYINDIWEYSSIKSLYTHLEYDVFSSFDVFKDWLMNKQTSTCLHCITLLQSDKCIGTITISDLNWDRKSCSIGYALSPKYQKKGFFNESLSIVLEELREIGFHRVWAITSQENIGSISALKRMKFQNEGVLQDYYLMKSNKLVDHNYKNAEILSLILN